MILANYGIVSSSSGGAINYDADALAFMTAASITDNTQKTAVNSLVTDLKTANIWSKMKALYPFVGGSATSHKFNLKDPRDLDAAFRLSFVGGGTHSATGYFPNGTTAYANTFIKPNLTLNSTNSHLSYYSRTDSSNQNMIGMQDDNVGAAPHYIVANKTQDSYAISCTDANRVVVNASNTQGFYVVSRESLTSLKGYKQGSLQGTNTATSLGKRGAINILIGAFNYRPPSGSDSISYGNKECSFSTIGDGLTDSEVTALHNAVQTFNTTLGRQV